jgi:spermidine synthase
MENNNYRRTALFVAGLFFFSGFAALVYQVTWMRHLALFLGSDVYSAAITLSAFMGGLSLGSFVAENVVDRLRRHLLLYGVIEIMIGLYALFFPDFLSGFSPFLKEIYRNHFETTPMIYQTVRVSIAALILIFPTALMGATLPLIVKCFVRKGTELGKFGGFFYAVNTFGALAGVLTAAFILFPLFGMIVTTRIAVTINLLVGTIVILVASRITSEEESSAGAEHSAADEGVVSFHYDSDTARIALVAIALSGLAALALEVVWTRILTLSFSATVYSFSIMLACFLFGIFLGSRMASRIVDKKPDPVAYFGYLEVAIGLMVALLGLLSYVVPGFFGTLLWSFTAVSGGNFGIASVIAKFLVSGLLIIVPTILLGATFPTAVRICTPGPERAGFGTGRVYAANTAGAIIGASLAGFVLIPAIGSRYSMLVIAGLFLTTGLMLLHRRSPGRFFTSRLFLGPVGLFVILAVGVMLLPRQTVLNFNMQDSSQPNLIYHGEGMAHSVDIVRNQKNNVIMMVDGNIEADTSLMQRRHFILKGHLPLLLHPEPSSVAVVGLGLGITLAATERNPGSEKIQLIELSPEMVEAHKFLEELTGGVLKSPKVSIRIDDGRNFFSMEDGLFDMITADPIHPRISGVGYLYTEEYYRAIAKRLKPGGVVCQWMPMYRISRESFDVAFRTFAKVFGNATFWYVRGHGLFVATREPLTIDFQQLRKRLRHPAVAADLESIGIVGPEQFLAHMLMGPAQIRAYLSSSRDETVNTDANAWLEYQTPFEFLMETRDIVSSLLPFASFDPDLFSNISESELKGVRMAWDKRLNRILPELDEVLE